MKALLIICAAIAVLALFWDGPEPRFPPGVLVPYEPEQSLLHPPTHWRYKDAEVIGLASFRIRARVLLTAHYWWDNESSVSPVDLTLGWRLMSNQEILDALDLYSLHRASSWRPRNDALPAPARDITAHSANMHMVPSTDALATSLGHVQRGDLIDLRGTLVEIHQPNGGIWRSSLTREDSGNGACELVWVTDLNKM
jgi:hypothetical protein